MEKTTGDRPDTRPAAIEGRPHVFQSIAVGIDSDCVCMPFQLCDYRSAKADSAGRFQNNRGRYYNREKFTAAASVIGKCAAGSACFLAAAGIDGTGQQAKIQIRPQKFREKLGAGE